MKSRKTGHPLRIATITTITTKPTTTKMFYNIMKRQQIVQSARLIARIEFLTSKVKALSIASEMWRTEEKEIKEQQKKQVQERKAEKKSKTKEKKEQQQRVREVKQAAREEKAEAKQQKRLNKETKKQEKIAEKEEKLAAKREKKEQKQEEYRIKVVTRKEKFRQKNMINGEKALKSLSLLFAY